MTAYKDLDNLTLREIMPPSITIDEQLVAVADALDPESQAISAAIGDNLPYLPRLDNLASRIVDLLAWAYHVDLYDSASAIADRRARVRAAIAEHKLHGTRAGVEAVLDPIFGDGNYTIVEWWEVDPTRPPYTFRIFIHVAFDSDDITEMLSRLDLAKSIRSHIESGITWDELDALTYTWDQLDALTLTWTKLDQWYFWVWIP